MHRWSQAVVVLVLAAMVFAAFPVEARTLYGASPASIDFDGGGDGLLRGAEATRTINIQNQGDEAVTFEVTTDGDIASWLRLATDLLVIEPNEKAALPVTVNVPDDAANGAYDAAVRLTPANVQQRGSDDGASSVVVQQLVVAIRVVVTDHQDLAIHVDHIRALDTERGGDLLVEAKMANGGNVVARPTLFVDVFDADGEQKLAGFTIRGPEVAPESGATALFADGPIDLPLGTYSVLASLRVDGGDVTGQMDDTSFFDVLEPGALAQSGEVVEVVFGPPDLEAREIAVIEVAFKNTGPSTVLAQFDGVVTQDGRPVATIQSDQLQVLSGEVVRFEEFWTPQDPGTYTLSGDVGFGGRQVAVDDTTLVVGGGGLSEDTPAPTAIMLAGLSLFALAVARRRWGA